MADWKLHQHQQKRKHLDSSTRTLGSASESEDNGSTYWDRSALGHPDTAAEDGDRTIREPDPPLVQPVARPASRISTLQNSVSSQVSNQPMAPTGVRPASRGGRVASNSKLSSRNVTTKAPLAERGNVPSRNKRVR